MVIYPTHETLAAFSKMEPIGWSYNPFDMTLDFMMW